MLKQLLNRDSSGIPAVIAGLPLNEWEPIKNLPKRHQDEILNKSEVIDYAAGDIIFMINNDDGKEYYLLEGSVELIDQTGNQVQLLQHSGSPSLELIDHHKPRIYSARVKQDCKIFVTRQTFAGTLNSARQALPELEVVEVDMEGSGSWMLLMLNSIVFANLPQKNLQQIFIQLDTIPVSKGDVIVEQDKLGEYFYLIQFGDCLITRRSENGEKKTLAHLGPGDTFGERSLLSGLPSDVAVEMNSDGVLMRIPADVFDTSIKNSLLKSVSIGEANALVAEGAGWIDVRNSEQYRQRAIKNSINVEIEDLYTAIKGLNPQKKFIICGDSKEQALASTFLFSTKGFTVYSLSSSVSEYLKPDPEKSVSVEHIAKQEIPAPILETTVEDHPTNMGEIEGLERTADKPPQIKIDPQAIIAKLPQPQPSADEIQNITSNLAKDLELQIRKEIHDLLILKQKELDNEINLRFKKYHQATAKLMKKKLDDLELEYKAK